MSLKIESTTPLVTIYHTLTKLTMFSIKLPENVNKNNANQSQYSQKHKHR